METNQNEAAEFEAFKRMKAEEEAKKQKESEIKQMRDLIHEAMAGSMPKPPETADLPKYDISKVFDGLDINVKKFVAKNFIAQKSWTLYTGYGLAFALMLFSLASAINKNYGYVVLAIGFTGACFIVAKQTLDIQRIKKTYSL